MKVLGIICEYNPFHNGHRYLIEKAKADTGCDAVIAVMSGNFSQRGLPTITDKDTRARIAVENGVDLVFELPAAFAVQSAQHFAQKGVDTLISCGIVDILAFGSECGDITALKSALNDSEGKSYSASVRSERKRSLASALANASDDTALYTPNNILGIEYLRALKKSGGDISPYTCKRAGVNHDSALTTAKFASASYLRDALYRGDEIVSYTPCSPCHLADLNIWESLVLYRLRTMSPLDLEQICGVSEGLQNRILAAAGTADSYEALVNAIKTKRYTRTRIERILTCAVLGIKQEFLLQPPYLRVLAMNECGFSMIRRIKEHASVIVKTADANHPILELECRADDVYSLLLKDKSGRKTFNSPFIKQNKPVD